MNIQQNKEKKLTVSQAANKLITLNGKMSKMSNEMKELRKEAKKIEKVLFETMKKEGKNKITVSGGVIEIESNPKLSVSESK